MTIVIAVFKVAGFLIALWLLLVLWAKGSTPLK